MLSVIIDPQLAASDHSPTPSKFSKTISRLLVLFKPPLLDNGLSACFIETEALRRGLLHPITTTKSTSQSLFP